MASLIFCAGAFAYGEVKKAKAKKVAKRAYNEARFAELERENSERLAALQSDSNTCACRQSDWEGGECEKHGYVPPTPEKLDEEKKEGEIALNNKEGEKAGDVPKSPMEMLLGHKGEPGRVFTLREWQLAMGNEESKDNSTSKKEAIREDPLDTRGKRAGGSIRCTPPRSKYFRLKRWIKEGRMTEEEAEVYRQEHGMK